MKSFLIFLCLTAVVSCHHKRSLSADDSLEEVPTAEPLPTAEQNPTVPIPIVPLNEGEASEKTVSKIVETLIENSLFVPQTLNLPILRLQTTAQAPVDSKEVYVDAQLKLDANDGTAPIQSAVQIRGRGNSTWGMPKKPYKLKFSVKTSLLGLPADKEWALLANYSDKTLLRTALAFEMGQRFGLAWTPSSRFIELFLNDNYLGTYQLTETIKIAKGRLNIDSLAATDIAEPNIAGGYLLEIDSWRTGEQLFIVNKLPFELHEPDTATNVQLHYVTALMQKVADKTAENVDIDSFINWYLVEELARNNDALSFSSIWMYKPRNGNLKMGPLWDFDIAFGNIDYNGSDNPEGWYIRDSAWYQVLFADPVFAARVRDRWNTLKASAIDTLPAFIDQQATRLATAQSNNFSRWLILDKKVWPNRMIAGTYEKEVAELKSWLQTRVNWMDAQFNPK